MPLLIIQAITALVVMWSSLTLLAKLAPGLGLVDTPTPRKVHIGSVPLVGGLAIYFTIFVCITLWPAGLVGGVWRDDQFAAYTLLASMGVIVIFGTLDDCLSLSIQPRVISEICVAAFIAAQLDLRVVNLGDLFGLGTVELGTSIGYVFTVTAIFGVINAVNMLDGMDGLVPLTLLTTLVFCQIAFSPAVEPSALLISVCLLGFLASNLQLVKFLPKTFLGDAGSRLLGLITACFLLASASSRVGGEKLVAPVTALYIISIPLYDMVLTVLRRAIRGKSPFSADRTHIHHLLLSLSGSQNTVLILVVVANLSANSVGLYLHKASVPEHLQLAVFCLGFLGYCFVVQYLRTKLQEDFDTTSTRDC